MARFSVVNRLKPSEHIANCTVRLTGPGTPPVDISATTQANGQVELKTTGLADGTYDLTVTARDTDTAVVGPLTGAGAAPPERIFRPLSAQVTLTSGALTAITVQPAPFFPGTARVVPKAPAVISVQPVWMRSPNHSGRAAHAVDTIIVHHTGGPLIGPAINTFLSTSEETSSHYIIDTDGEAVKMVHEIRAAHHAGAARWTGRKNLNLNTIGIEIVNASGLYPFAQYATLLRLLGDLRRTYTGIPARNVIGHSDIATKNDILGRKSGDPGLEFEWWRLENVGLGLMRLIGPMPADIYAEYFLKFPGELLRQGDNDKARKLGGKVRDKSFAGHPIIAVQEDLKLIGYEVGKPDGDYGLKTKRALEMFQEHFFAGARGHKKPDGKLDFETAMVLRSVAENSP